MGDLHGLPQACLRPQPGPRQCPQHPSSASSAMPPTPNPALLCLPHAASLPWPTLAHMPWPAFLSLPAASEPVVCPGQGRPAARLPQPHLLLPSAGCCLASSPSSVIKTSRQRRPGPQLSASEPDPCLSPCLAFEFSPCCKSKTYGALCAVQSWRGFLSSPYPALMRPPSQPLAMGLFTGALHSGEKWDFNIHLTFQRGRNRCVFQTNEQACGNSLKAEGWARDSWAGP